VIDMAAKALEISVDKAKQMPWDEIHGVATRAAERAVTRARDDLAPLARMIDDLARRNTDLAATAAMWQMRPAHLEDRLKQLTAGENPPEAAPEAPGSPRSDDQPWHGFRAQRCSCRRREYCQ